METPPVSKKLLLNSATKTSLTPCRRLGLSRPSSGSLKKTHLVRTLPRHDFILTEDKSNEVVKETSDATCADTSRLRLHDPCNVKARRCLTVSPDLDSKPKLPINESSNVLKLHNKDNVLLYCTPKKRKLDDKCASPTNIEREHSSGCITSEGQSHASSSDVEVTAEKIEEITQSIIEKKKKLEQLKVQEIYAKKHNLLDLRKQTEKWRAAGQNALRYSMNLAKQAGYSVSLKQLMTQHGFTPELIGYNSEDDEFE